MRFTCPICNRQFECPDEWAGEKIICPRCGADQHYDEAEQGAEEDEVRITLLKIMMFVILPAIMVSGVLLAAIMLLR